MTDGMAVSAATPRSIRGGTGATLALSTGPSQLALDAPLSSPVDHDRGSAGSTHGRGRGASSARPIARIVADGLNEYADYIARAELLPNHVPAAPSYWFSGLALDSRNAWTTPALRALLSDNAKRCWCGDRDCYACAFDCHGLCSFGCLAEPEVP